MNINVLLRKNNNNRRALREVLTNKEIIARLSETKAAREVAALEQFYTILREEPERAFYGFDYVIAAHNHQAIDTLLMTDELFRSRDPVERRKYVDLLESVKANGGTTYIFSTEHVSGERMSSLHCSSFTFDSTNYYFLHKINRTEATDGNSSNHEIST